jgi:hypothetical protein
MTMFQRQVLPTSCGGHIGIRESGKSYCCDVRGGDLRYKYDIDQGQL